ncbi:MAG TPA: oxidoreductase, partial [Gammaproteobacteria bacterium]|nr:oxidoreductase [Gammaproteobacteria bacterium]
CNITDTGSLGHNDMTDGSRGTFSSGMSTIFAARKAIEILRQRAADTWAIPIKDVTWEDGQAIAKGKKHKKLKPLSLNELAAASPNSGGPIAGHSQIVADGAGVSFASHICDIE